MVACKRPRKTGKPQEFTHCIYCQGLYSRKSLWAHMRCCKLKPKCDDQKVGKKQVQSLCAFACPVPFEVSQGLWRLVCDMTHDEISSLVKSDRCIILLGEHMYNKVGSDVGKHDYIRQKLREVGRLLIEARKKNISTKNGRFCHSF